MAQDNNAETFERRKYQRFNAKRRGEYCFWVVLDGARVPLVDLSMEGFSIPSSSPLTSERVHDFVLQRANVPDEVRGQAKAVNYIGGVGGGQVGCVFERLEGDGKERLEEWLTAHVLASATVPINEKEAAQIVSGPSLV